MKENDRFINKLTFKCIALIIFFIPLLLNNPILIKYVKIIDYSILCLFILLCILYVIYICIREKKNNPNKKIIEIILDIFFEEV